MRKVLFTTEDTTDYKQRRHAQRLVRVMRLKGSEEALEEAGDGAKADTAEDALDGLKEAVDDLEDGGSDLANNTKDGGEGLLNLLGGALENGAQSGNVTEGAVDGAQNLSDSLGSLGNCVADVLSGRSALTSLQADTAGQPVETAKGAGQSRGEVAQLSGNTINDRANITLNVGEEALDGLLDRSKGASEGGEDVLNRAKSSGSVLPLQAVAAAVASRDVNHGASINISTGLNERALQSINVNGGGNIGVSDDVPLLEESNVNTGINLSVSIDDELGGGDSGQSEEGEASEGRHLCLIISGV